MTELRKTVEAFWAASEARDWEAFAETLAEDVLYEAPLSRERVRGREAYVRFNREFSGDWHVRVERVVAEPGQAVSWIRFTLGDEVNIGISFFTGDEHGLITGVPDFWPDPYEPPASRAHLTERF
ncbi:nuclear transport factor 2 family protein [Streptomyces sp. P17]|uniref:nuclear transport factor 2 family protein n=1 Tax=Streptomyces sp. P17 TaxID=3074716 RepID=UPI0028F45192|nr:nuclear transport factor 2 family protein [Streptomyces sp. P17]MDT9701173.1 nuclear transport factor 2 family protein [Streptomyces sp. P17]